MWPFRRQPSNLEVLERLESLERRFKTLMADVDEYFQLVRRAENRIKEKRAKLGLESPEDGAGLPEVPQDGGATPAPFLTPRQKQIQQMVLRRRHGT